MMKIDSTYCDDCPWLEITRGEAKSINTKHICSLFNTVLHFDTAAKAAPAPISRCKECFDRQKACIQDELSDMKAPVEGTKLYFVAVVDPVTDTVGYYRHVEQGHRVRLTRSVNMATMWDDLDTCMMCVEDMENQYPRYYYHVLSATLDEISKIVVVDMHNSTIKPKPE